MAIRLCKYCGNKIKLLHRTRRVVCDDCKIKVYKNMGEKYKINGYGKKAFYFK